jgi:ureidoglycolate lyase
MIVRTVRVEPLTVEAFAPFGDVLGLNGERVKDGYGGTVQSYHPGLFESDVPVEFSVSRFRLRPFIVVWLERHFQITQTFIPLGGQPVIMAVAAPGARLEKDTPAPEEIHAFTLTGDVAVNLHRGTWHEPPLPLVEGTIVMTTHQHLPPEVRRQLDAEGRPLPDHDRRVLAESANLLVRLELP